MSTLLENYLSSTPVPQHLHFRSIGSTNCEALAWAEAGATDYSLVLADEQTEGRGRLDRRWITRPEGSLAFSLILKPTRPEMEQVALFSPLCALAVRDAVSQLFHLDCQIKWPNDVLIRGKKFSGILVEAAWMNDTIAGIVAGIGLNLTTASLPPEEYRLFPVTCLENETTEPLDRFKVLQAIILSIQEWRSQLGNSTFFATWQENLAFKGEWVRIEHSAKPPIIGKLKGIDQHGNLVLLVDGREQAFEIGDVHLRPG